VPRRLAAAALLAAALAGCAAPAERLARHAARLGFERSVVRGTEFEHVVYAPPARPGRTLHVYLDGDGIPWEAGRPASDPTPRRPLVLDLMARDPAPTVYLGRPCYHGATQGCTSYLWNEARYSGRVIASLAAAVGRLAQSRARIVLVGHSGGGTLAVLLASRVPRVAAVVTIAANLDTDAWADVHRLPRLTASLNPAREPPLPSHVAQHHYAGTDDRIVPPAIPARVAPPGTLRVVAGQGHACGWTGLWPSILDSLAGALTEP
jgi:predicted alpha/beta hydrolase family esterase